VLFYLAENLEARSAEFSARIDSLTGVGAEAAAEEVRLSIQRLTYYAAQADKYDGQVHSTRARHVTLAMNEPWGTIGILCPDEAPLLGLVSLVAPAIAMGNRCIVVPSQIHPLVATDLYQVLDTSDVPGGVVNIVTGERDLLAKTLAEHDEVAALWVVAEAEICAKAEAESGGNLKRVWTGHGRSLDWPTAQGEAFLRRAVEIKNVWVPYGE
jgi:aldehyde dehydrogenase (NAD+)